MVEGGANHYSLVQVKLEMFRPPCKYKKGCGNACSVFDRLIEIEISKRMQCKILKILRGLIKDVQSNVKQVSPIPHLSTK